MADADVLYHYCFIIWHVQTECIASIETSFIIFNVSFVNNLEKCVYEFAKKCHRESLHQLFASARI